MKSNKNIWAPLSSTAYGANAVYIPEWGKRQNLELIIVMTQNYPEFKTHPVMDCFHGYISGRERFDKNHDYRVIGWEIDLSDKFWSFIYLPSENNEVRAVVNMRANDQGRLAIEIDMQNPSDASLEWQFRFYIAPGDGLTLPGLKYESLLNNDCVVEIDEMKLIFSPEMLRLNDIGVCNSNGWINFPLNVEASYSMDDRVNRYKERLKITFEPILIPAHTNLKAGIDVMRDKDLSASELPQIVRNTVSAGELPYRHAFWEAVHNQQYIESAVTAGKMTSRVIPARQWYKFYLWDAGMTALGALEMDEKFAEDIIDEMPDTDLIGNNIFNFGSLIPTAVYALWELYQKTLDKELLAKHYAKMKKLLLFFYFEGARPEYNGIIPVLHGSGADDSPASFYANNEIFAWDYKKTLPVNPDRKKKILLSVGLTCHGIRGLKILRNISWLMDNIKDYEYFSTLIEKSESTLNNEYWHNECECFLERIANEKKLLKIPWIYNWLPLFSGSASTEKIQKMLSAIYDEDQFMTPFGLTLVQRNSENFRKDGYPNGSAWPPLQYFFWKAAYNIGELKLAEELAEKWMAVYEDNHRDTMCCWEEFRCDTGRGAGNSRFSGFQTTILAVWASRRVFGRAQFGHDIIPEALFVDTAGKRAELSYMSPFYCGQTSFSIVLNPGCSYEVLHNHNRIALCNTDKYGFMSFNFEATNIKNGRLVIQAVER